MSNLTINTEHAGEDIEFEVTKRGKGFIRFREVNWYNVLNAAELYQVYDWIEENFERPKEPTLFETQWPQVKIGDEFGFGPSGSAFPYVKFSETSYGHHKDNHEGISGLTKEDHARGITWRTPEPPTPLEQFQALNKGEKFHLHSTYGPSDEVRVKISDTEWVNLTDGRIYPTSLLLSGDKIEPVV